MPAKKIEPAASDEAAPIPAPVAVEEKATPRPFAIVRTVHLEFGDEFDGVYRGWYADMRVNLTQAELRRLTASGWQAQKEALAETIVAWNFKGRFGQEIDPADPAVYEDEVTTDVLSALMAKWDEAWVERTRLPKASPSKSSSTS